MKVDVYPNITNVEVYENPISVPVEATWEKVIFTVPDPIVNTYDLGRQVATDRDGDYVIQVHYDSTEVDYATDFTVTDTKINWVSTTPLVVGQKITVWYSPKSAYGSVPGSGEVTSLTHLNDVTVAGPLPGQLLMRDGNNQFVNRSLTAGDNITITSDGDGITIASGVVNQVNASTIAQGIVRLATVAEAAGTSQALAITPKGLQEELSDLSTVATSGSYADLSNTPTIPTSLSDLSDVSLSGTLIVGEVMRYNGSTFVDSKLVSTDLSDSADLARIDSPALTGTPTAPTPAEDDSSTKIATTAYVQTEISGLATASQGSAGNVNVANGSGGFNSSTWEVSNNHLLPTANEQYDIGSADNRVRDIYLSNNSLKFGANNLSLALNNQGKLTFDSDLVLTDETFATVASTGAYSDLIGAPTLSNVATSGAYADLSGTPTLSTVATSGAYADLSGTPSLSTVATSGSYNDLSNLPSLATIATSGSFADLQNTPTASTTTAGIVELATLQETATGTDATRAVTPAGLAAELSGIGTSDKVFEGQAKVEAFDDGSADGAVIKFSVDPNNTGSPVEVWNIDGNGHLIPQTHEAYDLGKADAKVRHLYLSDNSIKMGDNNKEISLSGARLNYDGNNVTTDNLLSDVATSGSYADLSNKPTIPNASTDLTDTADLARLASPALTGTPTAPTANAGTNTTQIATTAFVRSELAGIVGGVTYKGTINVGDFATTLANAEQGDFYKIATGGTASDNRVYATNDSILINTDMGGTYSDAKVDKIDNTEAVTSVNSLTGAITLSANDLAADHTASNYTATNANIDGHLSGIDTALSSLGAQNLNGLSDVTITGASTGEVIRYNGSAWVDTQLGYSDLSGTPTLGSSAALDAGTSATNVVQLDGSGNLPAVDGSALTGITANQVGALSTLSSSAMTDLGDVNYTAGVGIDGYVLTYSHSNTRWEAVSAQGDSYIVQTSSATVHVGSKYIIPVSVNSNLTFEVPVQVDSGVVEIVNLSAQTIVIKGSTGRLYTADGAQAPSFGGYTRILYESKGTIKLVRDKDSSVNGEWYAHFHYPIETVSTGLLEGDALVYEATSKSFKPSGINPGEFVLTGNVGANLISGRYKYVTAYDESSAREVEIGNPYDHTEICAALDGRRIYFENRGSSTLSIAIDQGPYSGGVYYRTYFYTFAGTNQSGVTKVLQPGESAVIECVYDSNASAPTLKLFYQLYGHNPNRIVETDSSATNTTLTVGNEHHKLVNVDNGASAVTLTLPLSANTRPGYLLDIKALGAGAVTVQRGGSELIDGSQSISMSQYQSLRLLKATSGWSVLKGVTSSQSLGGLTDVTITGAGAGEVIRYNGSAWVDAQLAYSDLSGTPSLATVATSGSYNDLSNKPTLGTAAALDSGTSNGNVVVLDATGLPAVDGSQLTNVTGTDATKLSITNNLSDLNNEGTARTNLGLAIGTDVQAYDAGLQSISALTTAANKMIYTTASDTYAVADLTSAGRALLDDADATAQRTTLGLGTAAVAATTDFLSGTGADALGGDLDVGGHDIVSSSNGAINLAPNGSGVVTILGNTTGGSGQIKLNCENNSHGIIIKGPPHSASASYTLTLPNDDGSANQILETDGSGGLSWVDQASAGSTIPDIVVTGNSGDVNAVFASSGNNGENERIYLINNGSNARTVTLPAVSGNSGKKLQVKRLGSANVTIAVQSNENLENLQNGTFILSAQYSSVTLVCNASGSIDGWYII